MGYAGLTAFIDTEDQRSHADWVNAMYTINWQGKGVPEELKPVMVQALDIAANGNPYAVHPDLEELREDVYVEFEQLQIAAYRRTEAIKAQKADARS